MKISDFGKSGPRVVTAGLTCASATPGATAIQPAAASMTMKTLPGTLDIFALPALVLFCGSLSRRAALSRPLGSAEPPAGRTRAFAPDRQRVIYLHELCRRASARESSAVTKSRSPENGAIAMSMQSVASPAVTFTPPKRNSLTHIPGDEGWPLIGKTLEVLADPKGQIERQAAKYGLIYRSHIFGETSVVLLGPDANELVLFDQAKQFSSTHGWGQTLALLLPVCLMLLDFVEHRLHRRALSVAFKSGPMKSYLAALDTGIAARVAQWKSQPGPMLLYPAMKQLTLDLAATSFLGAGIGPEVDEITRAFVA